MAENKQRERNYDGKSKQKGLKLPFKGVHRL